MWGCIESALLFYVVALQTDPTAPPFTSLTLSDKCDGIERLIETGPVGFVITHHENMNCM